MSVSTLRATALLRPERPADAAQVEALIERVFGPGRLARAAERLRERNRQRIDLSPIALAGERAVGTARLWPVTIGKTPALLLGPFAVDEAWRGGGLGAALIGQACDRATAAGCQVLLLVGDQAYFGPFGFTGAPAAGLIMPGPVDPARVLVRVTGPATRLEGRVAAAPLGDRIDRRASMGLAGSQGKCRT